jgi:hypothetical protein
MADDIYLVHSANQWGLQNINAGRASVKHFAIWLDHIEELSKSCLQMSWSETLYIPVAVIQGDATLNLPLYPLIIGIAVGSRATAIKGCNFENAQAC